MEASVKLQTEEKYKTTPKTRVVYIMFVYMFIHEFGATGLQKVISFEINKNVDVGKIIHAFYLVCIVSH